MFLKVVRQQAKFFFALHHPQGLDNLNEVRNYFLICDFISYSCQEKSEES